MMGVTRHFDHSNDPLDAGEPEELALPQLYVMPTPQQLEGDAVPIPVKSGKLLQLPVRSNGSAFGSRPRRQFHSNTVDWPRGYPSHDDL